MEQTFDSFVNTRVQLSQSIGDESRRRRERTNETDGDVDGYDEVMRFADRDAGCQTTVGRLFELGNVWAMGSVQWDHVLASRSITGLGAQFISAWKRFIPKTKETKSYRQQKNLLLLYRIEKKKEERNQSFPLFWFLFPLFIPFLSFPLLSFSFSVFIAALSQRLNFIFNIELEFHQIQCKRFLPALEWISNTNHKTECRSETWIAPGFRLKSTQTFNMIADCFPIFWHVN